MVLDHLCTEVELYLFDFDLSSLFFFFFLFKSSQVVEGLSVDTKSLTQHTRLEPAL